MNTAVTVRLDEELNRMLDQVCQRQDRNRSEVIREALRRQLSALLFEQLRNSVAPFAEISGYLVDEDVFRDIS